MGQKDLSGKKLESEPEVFADIFNTLVFKEGDCKILNAESNLSDIPTESIYTDFDGNMRNIFRDVFKEYASIDTGIYLAYIGVENQATVERIMPIRSMGYAYTAYKKQADDYCRQRNALQKLYEKADGVLKEVYRTELGKLGNFKAIPVISIVLNFSRKDWNQPKSITGLSDETNPYIRYATDHQIIVFDVHKFDEKTRAKFTSDFRIFVEFFCTGKLPTELTKLELNHPTELVDMLIAYGVDANNLQEIRNNVAMKELKGEKMNMRTVFAEIKEEAILETAISNAISNAIFCIENGIEKEKVIEKIAADLNYSKEEAEEFFEREVSGKLSM